jgi:hypothetical protein
MKYCMSLPFHARPEYQLLKELFLNVIAKNQPIKDFDQKDLIPNFDWMIKRASLIRDYERSISNIDQAAVNPV